MTQTTMTLTDTYTNARIEAPRPGSTTWYKGKRCTVVDSNMDDFPQPMVRVAFADGYEAILKLTEVGLKAADVARLVNK